jgi:type IV pilus assembly protein PilM
MLSSKSLLCIDFGAGSLKAAEFDFTETGSLCLRKFGVKPLGPEGAQDSAREGAIQRVLQELLADKGFSAKNVNACAPGFHVFSKFVKLPPVDTSKVTQIIQYEAQQNVPFPLEEVVWDYQITGTTATGELEVFLVAIKGDIVEGLFRTNGSAGLRLQLVDVSPAALCNAFRYNYSDQEGCSMLLDIGAKTSNVLFFEKGKYSSRGINIGANSITQDFAMEAKMPFSKAEQFKIAAGFVSLGGAYEEPENPQQAQISKIARQVMTRLHIQVNQTMEFYRRQQGGAAPQRLFLAGGASIMPYTAQFFSEKLNLPVEYFNPLRNIQIDPSINLEDLAKVAHSLGEVVGLGLRNLAECPIELNLMPNSIRKQQQLSQKKPYFIATAASVVLGLLAMGWFYDAKVVAAKRAECATLQTKIDPLQQVWDKNLEPVLNRIKTLSGEANLITSWVEDRLYWGTLLNELHKALIETESKTEEQINLQGTRGAKTGVWIERLLPELPTEAASEEEGAAGGGSKASFAAGMPPEMRARYGFAEPAAEAAPAAKVSTNEITTINLTCTAVNLKKTSETANRLVMNTLEARLQARTNLFLPKDTILAQKVVEPDADALTYSFKMILKLKRPIKF